MSQEEARRFRRPSRMLKVALPTAAALGAGGALAAAGVIPSSDGVISACYDTADVERPGDLRVVSDTDQCDSKVEQPIEWNQQGPRGPQGIPGPAGANGANGANGVNGANGPAGPAGPPGASGRDGSNGSSGSGGKPIAGFPATIVNNGNVDVFIKFSGLDGESTSDKHKDWTELRSFAWGAASSIEQGGPRGGAGGKASRAAFSSFYLTKRYDRTSVSLLKALVDGKAFSKVEVEVVRQGEDQQTQLKYKFEDAFVDNYSQGGEILSDNISFSFSKVTVEYFPQSQKGKSGGSVKATYDLTTNKVS